MTEHRIRHVPVLDDDGRLAESSASTASTDPKTMQALEMLPDQEFPNQQAVIDAVPQEPEGADQPGGPARALDNENPEEKP